MIYAIFEDDLQTAKDRKLGSIENLLSNACGVDQDIRSSMSINNSLDCIGNSVLIADVNLSKFDWDLRACELVQLSSGGVTKILVGVKDDNGLSTGLDAGASHIVTQTTGTTTNQYQRYFST